jgi:hypothetical protein
VHLPVAHPASAAGGDLQEWYMHGSVHVIKSARAEMRANLSLSTLVQMLMMERHSLRAPPTLWAHSGMKV